MNPIWGLIDTVVKKIWPDTTEQDLLRLKIELEREAQQANIDIEQTKANAEQAKSTSLFVAGARPFAMWVCGIILAFSAVVKVVLPTILILMRAFSLGNTEQLSEAIIALQAIDVSMYIGMLSSLLGLGYLARTYEKTKNVTK